MEKDLKTQLDEIVYTSNLISDLSLKKSTDSYISELFKGKSLEQIQAMDPISEWEKVNKGKNYKENGMFDNFSLMGFTMAFNKAKNARLAEAKETHIGTTFEEFVNMMLGMGFKIGFKQEFKSSLDNRKETEIIMFDDEYGFIIYATSYGKSLNSATLYGELEPVGYKYQKGDEEKYPEVAKKVKWYAEETLSEFKQMTLAEYVENNIEAFATPARSSGGRVIGTKNRHFNFDMREGAVAKINKLKTDHTFARPAKHWLEKCKFIVLKNYSKKEEDNKDYTAIANKKLLKCPKEVLGIVNDPERFGIVDTDGDTV